jgi:hypothetical protein
MIGRYGRRCQAGSPYYGRRMIGTGERGMSDLGPSDALVRAVRVAVYRAVERTGQAPTAVDVARATSATPEAIERAYLALADAHVIVLEPDGVTLRWAPPFSLVPTRYRVRAGRSSWFAPCAWDAFGIAAALDCDVKIDAVCAASGEPIGCGVEHDLAYGAGVIHLLVPAAHFWDDIAYT